MRKFIALAVALVLLSAGVVEWIYASFAAPGPVAPHGSETVVLVKSGIGLNGVAQALSDAGVVLKPGLFKLGVRLHGETSELKAGEYAIPSHASMYDIMNILIGGHSIEHKLTVAEGLTSQMAYDLVAADPVLTGEAGPVPPEGALLPETYLFVRGTTRAGIIAKMEKAERDLIDALWAKRAPGLPFETKEQAVILASIVEKESSIPAERRHIASVFINRLRLGMKLQSDPTIIYGITKGYPLGRGIRQSEIDSPTPYNTYAIAGLPPQPICDPGKDSLEAVFNPADTKDLYFVADGTGGHVFAATAEEQAKNVAKWRKIEKEQRK
ncbi:MAG: endolytic transglycosylase MltG [Alphaproteobacteria bacterium]|nr:endolytic transglycosylase MltG [Alphaproteobacteria bacterium]MDE2494842.1 endolytic transglycosylase MltG [Alphaproteobacteria bacterium]